MANVDISLLRKLIKGNFVEWLKLINIGVKSSLFY